MIAGRISQAVAGAVGNIGGGLAPSGSGFGNGGTPAPATPAPQSSLELGGGGAAGEPGRRLALWTNASNSWIANNQTGVNFAGTIQTAVIGADYLFTDKIIGGITGGYEHPDIHTKFNAGTFKGNNVAITPYAAYIIDDIFSVDATAGYTFVSYDITRSSNSITGSTDGHRLAGSADLNANKTIDSWVLGSSLGASYLNEVQNAYTETGAGGTAVGQNDVRLGQAHLTGKAGYLVTQPWGSITPYGSARMEYDFNHNAAVVRDVQGDLASNSRFGTVFGLGADAAVGNFTTLNLEGTTTQFRENVSAYMVSASVRVKF
ncbi:MAG TPA: autotransporter outer membrane beta-barrel domain-containing protein [Patescibacteria group bacterium]|nr:autotransporter outer membrane beta-barrel domain-containing protein [Patescibacteria group bacterium]